MKILKGQLKETRYLWPTVQLNNGDRNPLQIEAEKTYGENEVTYMSDKLGLHKISNPDPEDYAVSLHCRLFYLISKMRIITEESIHTAECSRLRVSYLQRADWPAEPSEDLPSIFRIWASDQTMNHFASAHVRKEDVGSCIHSQNLHISYERRSIKFPHL